MKNRPDGHLLDRDIITTENLDLVASRMVEVGNTVIMGRQRTGEGVSR